MSISFLSVEVVLAGELVALGPAVHSLPVPVVLVEEAIVELHKGADRETNNTVTGCITTNRQL